MLQKLRRGSMTAEGAFIIPLVFLLFVLILLLTFQVHNRMWYRCAAYEAAIAGNGTSESGEDGTKQKAEALAGMRVRDQVMPGPVPEAAVRETSGGTEVKFSAGAVNTYFGAVAGYKAEALVKRVRPEKVVRLKWAAERLTE